MFEDGRSKKVVFIAHCFLNQNSISDGTAVYPAVFRNVPLVMTALFITISFLEKTAEYAITGIISIVAIIIVWFIGYFKSAKYEKSEIDKMKAKDIQ